MDIVLLAQEKLLIMFHGSAMKSQLLPMEPVLIEKEVFLNQIYPDTWLQYGIFLKKLVRKNKCSFHLLRFEIGHRLYVCIGKLIGSLQGIVTIYATNTHRINSGHVQVAFRVHHVVRKL